MNGDSGRAPIPITVLTIDDHAIVRQSIRHLLAAEPGVLPVLELPGIEPALEWLETHRVDVALLDNKLADGSGVDAIPRLHRVRPDLQIIVLTVCDEEETLLRAIRNGACGYLLKDAAPVHLIEAIHAAALGECRVAGRLTRSLFQRLNRRVRPRPETSPEEHGARLSARDAAILGQLAQGLSNKEIARALAISPNTVRNQLQRLQERFDARNRVQLALFAREQGIG